MWIIHGIINKEGENMNWEEIKKIILEANERRDNIIAYEDKQGYIRMADGCIKINNIICIRNIYVVHNVGDTLWINETTIDLDDVEKVMVLGW